MILQTFHKPRLVEFNSSFGDQRLQDKTHNEVKNDQAPVDKHLVSTKDPPTSKQILTQDELDDRIMVIIMVQN